MVGAARRWVDARLLVCGTGALALHALALLGGDGSSSVRSLTAQQADSASFEVSLLSGERGDPGGGSAAVAPAVVSTAARVSEARRSSARPRVSKAPRPAPVRPERDALLASAYGADSFLSQVRPVRASLRDLLGPSEPHAAEPLSRDGATLARSIGSAPGVREGRGGPGAGAGTGGRVTGDFAFGGSSGALRAEMCFIPPGTRRLRDVAHCSGGAVFFTDELNVESRRFEEGFPGVSARNEWFSIRYTGAFRIERAGEYRYRLKSDDGSQLFIDDELVIDLDGVHDAVSKRGAIELERGVHTITVRYFQGPRYTIALQLFVTPPGQTEQIFRPAL